MRAGRLIAMLLTLQDHGRMTAARLAEQLEVSERTVLRDVEALSTAGVPIYAVPGPGGGIELVDGFRAGPAGMTPEQAAAVLVCGQPRLASLLGLAVPARSARGILLRALPPALAPMAAELDSWFLHDPLGRDARPERAEELRQVVRAIRLRVELRFGPEHRLDPVRPLALVLEAGVWRLVHLRSAPGGPRPELLTLPDPLGPCRLGRGFDRPELDLAGWWAGIGTNHPEAG